MADDPTSDTDEGPEPDPEPRRNPASNTGPDKDWQAETEKWKALARKHEKAAADLRPLADKAKELEDASKSDIERAASEAQQHLARADKAEGELLRLRVALRKGLTETQAKRLVGSTEDELEADADDLMASFRPAEPKKDEPEEEPEPTRPDNSRRRPQERLRPGAVPDADTEPEETDPRKLAALVQRPFLG